MQITVLRWHVWRCAHDRPPRILTVPFIAGQRPEQGTGTACRLWQVRDARRRSRAAGSRPTARWLAYGINRSNRDNELRVASVASGETKIVAFGSQATFSADSQWVAYAIGYSEAQEEKLRQQKKPIHRKLGTLKLASGEMTTVDGIEAFAFNASGTHLAMKRYAPERKDRPTRPRRQTTRRQGRRSSSASWKPDATRRSAT